MILIIGRLATDRKEAHIWTGKGRASRFSSTVQRVYIGEKTDFSYSDHFILRFSHMEQLLTMRQKDEEMNEFVGGLMLDMYLFEAFIGITDEKVEGKWTYMDDGAPVKFFQWNFKGQWHRRDKNCASIMLAKYQWRQYNCRDHLPFICQIPFY
ncbi:hypothetical protein Avbf_05270 [Armadillidium vulgare]|nr:hypothetical protein Avbf_05270 [Armadillidium vulgare]